MSTDSDYGVVSAYQGIGSYACAILHDDITTIIKVDTSSNINYFCRFHKQGSAGNPPELAGPLPDKLEIIRKVFGNNPVNDVAAYLLNCPFLSYSICHSYSLENSLKPIQHSKFKTF
jgi:hypothetical protein